MIWFNFIVLLGKLKITKGTCKNSYYQNYHFYYSGKTAVEWVKYINIKMIESLWVK